MLRSVLTAVPAVMVAAVAVEATDIILKVTEAVCKAPECTGAWAIASLAANWAIGPRNAEQIHL